MMSVSLFSLFLCWFDVIDKVLGDVEYEWFLAEYLFGFDFLIEEVGVLIRFISFKLRIRVEGVDFLIDQIVWMRWHLSLVWYGITKKMIA